MRTTGPRPTAIAILAAGFIVAACSSAGSGSSVAPAPSVVASAPPAPASVAPSASQGSMVIEDAGVETSLPAGTYSSRLFKPALTLELGEGWYRRDPNGDKALNLRRTQNQGEDVTFISGIDFIQCGEGDPIAAPDVAKIVAGLTGSTALKVSEPVDVPFGDHTGTALKLEGGGAPIPEADFVRSSEFGCILSQGEAFPAESFWLMATRDVTMHLVVADVDGTTVIVRTRPGDTTSDLDALYDQTLKVLADSKIG